MTWSELRRQRPDLAEAGRELFYFFGPGLGFLATVRKDGGPRVHPICPVITDDGLYAFIIPSPKLDDLLRDGRYALHSTPLPDNDDAFYLTGRAGARRDAELRQAVSTVYTEGLGRDEPLPGLDDETLVEFQVETCLLTRTKGHADMEPVHTIWKAGGPMSGRE